MLSITVVVLMAVLVRHHPAAAQRAGSPCFTRHGQRGICQNLSICESLVKILPPHGITVRDFLSQSVCTYVGKKIYVCCPNTIDKNYNNNNNNNNDNNNTNSLTRPTASPSYGPLLPPVCGTTDAKYTRIVGGVPAKLGQWPWITALGYRPLAKTPNKVRWLCGGSLISARHVLTAAHCIYKHDDLFIVRLGDLDLEDDYDGATPIDALIERRKIHPHYNPTHHTNDIGVLRLQNEIQFTPLIRPLCLPVTDNIIGKNLEGTFPFVVGWGSIYFRGPVSSRLLQIQVPIVSLDQCKEAYINFKDATIDDRVMCAGFYTGKDACKGDSGGPLMYPIGKNFYAIGVVSYGFKCAEPGYPGIYTNVTSFLDFIIPRLD